MLLHMSQPALSHAEGTRALSPVHELLLLLLLLGALHRVPTDVWTNATQSSTCAAWRCIWAVPFVCWWDAAEAHLLWETTGGGPRLHLLGRMPALPYMSSA